MIKRKDDFWLVRHEINYKMQEDSEYKVWYSGTVSYTHLVHPLTLVAGIKIGKKLKVPCICEIRDLWPESFIAHNILKRTIPY